MAMISVSDAAKRAKLNPEEFLKKLKEFGIYAEDVQSTFDSSKLPLVLSLLHAEETPIVEKVEKRISSGVVRRRRRGKSRGGQEEPEEDFTADEAEEPEEEISVPANMTPEQAAVAAVEAEDEAKAAAAAQAEQQSVEQVEQAPKEVPTEQEPVQPAEPNAAETPVEQADEQAPAAETEVGVETEAVEAESAPEPESQPEATAETQTESSEEAAETEEIKIETLEDLAIPKSSEADAESDGAARKKSRKKAKRVVADIEDLPLGKIEKPKGAKKLPIRGVTKEPARIVSLPDRKIETLKPSLQVEEPQSPAGVDAPGREGDRRGKKGRRVVEVGKRFTGGARKKKKEVWNDGPRGKRKKKEQKSTEITVPKAIKRKIKIVEQIQVGELAHRMGIKAGDLISKLISQGVLATINQYIDFDTAVLIAEEFGFEIENVSVDEDDIFKLDLSHGQENAEQEHRRPVVTIMGHVDHGKTTLLDTIRKTRVVEGEAGGITQHIGAYQVKTDRGTICFLDTPGHETFTAMRARGAQVTDIVILIVAADDGVMPQTVEAINHAKDANVPIIVAVNKVDKPGADPQKIRQTLTEHQLVPEEWGGDTMFAEISAKFGDGIDGLLEMILLQAEMMELTSVVDQLASGFIIEARLSKGRGPVATVLVKEGTLKVGDPIVADRFWGRVRSMADDRGNRLDSAGPSTPIEVIGLGGVPPAGSTFNATNEERMAKQVAELRDKKAKELEQRKVAKVSLEDFYSSIKEGGMKELKLIVKGDVQGSVGAIKDAVTKLTNDEVKVVVIHSGVGAISETDINFAIASAAIVIGFNVRPEPKARTLAEREDIDVRTYEVIYDLVNEVKSALEGMLDPEWEEEIIGRAEVRDTFHISKIGTIAGCHVTEGKMVRNARARLLRDEVVIFNGKLNSLKRFKEDAKEVLTGFECGIGLEGYNDIKVGDVFEAFEMKQIPPKLKN